MSTICPNGKLNGGGTGRFAVHIGGGGTDGGGGLLGGGGEEHGGDRLDPDRDGPGDHEAEPEEGLAGGFLPVHPEPGRLHEHLVGPVDRPAAPRRLGQLAPQPRHDGVHAHCPTASIP